MTPEPEDDDAGDRIQGAPEQEPLADDAEALRAKAAERDQYLDRLQRTMAEFQNYKNRVGREKADQRKFVTAEVVRAFLPVLDNLERAVAAAKDETDPLLDGVRMVIGEFHRRLEQLGVKPVQTAGARFDPSQMEAVLRVDDSDAEENTVLDVFEKGYRLDDFVVRHARVSVAGAKPKQAESLDEEGPVPTYDYECSACANRLEAFQSMSDPPLRKCPKCGKLRLKRLIGAGAGVIFKGTGFYTTDYRSSSYAASKKSDTEAPAKSEAKTDPGTCGKPACATDGCQSSPPPSPAPSKKPPKKK